MIGVTPDALRRWPGDVLGRIERVHRHAGDRPRPQVIAVRR